MSPLSVLAAVGGAQDDEEAVVIAADLAHRHGTTAVVVNTFAAAPTAAMAPAFGGAALTPRILEAIVDRRREVELGIQALVDRIALRVGAGAVRLVPSDGPVSAVLRRELPLSDLAVLAQSSVSGEVGWTSPLGETLIEARAPVYLARDREPVAGRLAAIAWDGSFEAARAVRAALPLLQEASELVILQSRNRLDTSEGSRADPTRLAAWLTSHGLSAGRLVTVDGGKVGPELLKACAEVGAGLLVAGAYRHSRLGEALFGGATRAFLEAAKGPHLLVVH
jgi:nucleotide-binding universal stress UspA family protein